MTNKFYNFLFSISSLSDSSENKEKRFFVICLDKQSPILTKCSWKVSAIFVRSEISFSLVDIKQQTGSSIGSL